jgi:ubiquinone/menaquinone biosynthesis C-methylase UbiE
MSDRDSADALPWTGERFVPEVSGQVAMEHLHRYLIAAELVAGKQVLDIACGEGYGSAALARTATSVVGVDIAEEAVKHAAARYRDSRLRFLHGTCLDIPIPSQSVDVVVSFETIEHVSEHDQVLREFRRVLRPGGLLIMSSPDKREYSDIPGYRNPFHVRELYREEFRGLLQKYFAHIEMLGQRMVYGSAIFSEGSSSVACSWHISNLKNPACSGLLRPTYLIGLASDVPIESVLTSFLEQPLHESEAFQGLQASLSRPSAPKPPPRRRDRIRDALRVLRGK